MATKLEKAMQARLKTSREGLREGAKITWLDPKRRRADWTPAAII